MELERSMFIMVALHRLIRFVATLIYALIRAYSAGYLKIGLLITEKINDAAFQNKVK